MALYKTTNFETFQEAYQAFVEREEFLNQLNTEIIKKAIAKKSTKAPNPNRVLFHITEHGLQQANRRSKVKLNLTGIITRLTSKGIDELMIYGVEVLNLSATLLTEIPNQISDLTSLKELNLSYNELVNLPTSFPQLINLKQLNLSNNFFNEIPEVIYLLTTLKGLNIGNFKPSMTTCICCDRLGQRTTGNQVTTLSPRISELTQLKYLQLMSIGLESLPSEISRLEHLEFFNLLHNDLRHLPRQLPPKIQENRQKLWVAGNPVILFHPVSVPADQIFATLQTQIVNPGIRRIVLPGLKIVEKLLTLIGSFITLLWHSTISPETTQRIQNMIPRPLVKLIREAPVLPFLVLGLAIMAYLASVVEEKQQEQQQTDLPRLGH